jgi:hypothetical protein
MERGKKWSVTEWKNNESVTESEDGSETMDTPKVRMMREAQRFTLRDLRRSITLSKAVMRICDWLEQGTCTKAFGSIP